MKNCNWCEKVFEANVSYQIYCSEKCRTEATKEKIAQRYIQQRRQRRKGKSRICKMCKTSLSIYNDEPLCNNCLINPSEVDKTLKEIKRLLNE
jgi:hypothetical protein